MRFRSTTTSRITSAAIIIAVAVLCPVISAAQNVSVTASVDRTEITIGDLVNLEVVVVADTTLKIKLPPTEGLLGVFEVKDYNIADPVIDENGQQVFRSQFSLTTWTTGTWLVPPLTVTFSDTLGHVGTASSDSLFITVKSILAGAGADTVDIRDLKPLYSVPTKRAIYYYLGGVLLLLAAGLWYFLRHRRREEKLDQGDTRTAWERAYDDLNELQASDYLAKQQWRLWYFSLTEIYRRYLDSRFHVETLEATTDEVKNILPSIPLGESGRKAAEQFLDYADLVKFARLAPEPSRPEDDFNYVRRFVDQTKVETVVKPEPTVETTGTDG